MEGPYFFSSCLICFFFFLVINLSGFLSFSNLYCISYVLVCNKLPQSLAAQYSQHYLAEFLRVSSPVMA